MDFNIDFESMYDIDIDIAVYIFTGIVISISTFYFIYHMYNRNNRNNRNSAKKNIIYPLVGLFEIVKTNTDSNEEEKYFSVGNFINTKSNLITSACNYITFIPGFLKDDFKFNKFRVVAISYNNGAFNEIKSSTSQKDILKPTMAHFKAFNIPHYYLKIKYDTCIIDIFHDVFPTIIYQNKYVISDLKNDKVAIA
jgi:hypothetical protein